MSTASLPPQSTPAPPHPSDGMIAERIELVRSALWRSELTRSLLLLVLFVIAILLGWAIVDQWIWSGGPMMRLAAWGAMVGVIIVWSMRRIVPLFTSRIDASYAAFSIERDIPDIKHALSSYVALRDQRDASGLRGVVVRSIGSRAAGRLKQHEGQLPSEVRGSFRLGMMVAIAFAVLAAYAVLSPKDTIHSAGRLILPFSSIEPPTRVRIWEVAPGHVEILAGRKVEVTARMTGLGNSDEPGVLWEFAGEQRKIPMRVDAQRGLPFFTASLGGVHGIESSGHYTVAAGDASSERFRIVTSDVPVVHVESVHYSPPAYTKRPEHTSRAAAIEGIEGTTVTVLARTNRPVTEAQIELNPRTAGGRTTATAGVFPMQIDSAGTMMTAEILLRIGADQPGVVPLSSYRMRVTDSDGAQNPEPVVYPIRILPDLAPEVTIVTPVRNPKEVPVDAQQLIEVHALDPDFGLTQVAVQMERGSQRLDDVVLWQDDGDEPRNRVALYRLRPRDLGLHPGDVLTVRARAADNRIHPTRSDAAPNITLSGPVELRIVAAAKMNESRPSEDGLSAPDDQPAVDPPQNEPSQSEDQQQDGGDASSSSSGASGDSGAGDESSGEGDASEGGSPSEGTSEGEQEGSSSTDSKGQGSGSQANDPSDAETDNDQQNGASDGEAAESEMTGDAAAGGDGSSESQDGQPASGEGSGPGEASKAADSSQPSQPRAEDGQQPQEGVDPSAADSDAATEGSDAPRNGSQTPAPQEGADRSVADSDAATEGSDAPKNGSQTPAPQEGAEPSADGGDAAPAGSDVQENRPQAPTPGEGTDPSAGERGDTTERSGSQEMDGDPNDRGETGSGAEAGDREPKPPGPPEHDGEAIERMKEYLDEQQARTSESSRPDPRDAEGGGDATAAEQESSAESTSPSTADGQPSAPDRSMGEDSSTDSASSPEGDASQDGDQSGDSADAPQNSEAPSGSESPAGDPSAKGDPATDSSEADPTGETSEGDPSDPGSSSAAGQPSPNEQPTANGEEQRGESPGSSADSSATTGSSGSPDTDEGTTDFVESDETPEPVDLEYAKKATDMVLDYLKETRDQPDQALLDRLNWTEEDMNRFLSRWESARQMERGDGGDGSREFEEALRSLGIRDRSTSGRGAEAEQADRLRDLRDSGQRRPAPTLYRDAFEAFRRSVAR